MNKNIGSIQKKAKRIVQVFKSHKGKNKAYLKRFGSRPAKKSQ